MDPFSLSGAKRHIVRKIPLKPFAFSYDDEVLFIDTFYWEENFSGWKMSRYVEEETEDGRGRFSTKKVLVEKKYPWLQMVVALHLEDGYSSPEKHGDEVELEGPETIIGGQEWKICDLPLRYDEGGKPYEKSKQTALSNKKSFGDSLKPNTFYCLADGKELNLSKIKKESSDS